MKNALILALAAVIALLTLSRGEQTQAVIEDTTFHHADWQTCISIPNGPIRRPDNYSAKPHGRRSDEA